MTTISNVPERRAWQALGPALPRPRAILAISAHWETQGKTHVTVGNQPRTIHDFRGFPPELYAIEYPAPGCTELVQRVTELLGEGRVFHDPDWGFDHGAWGVLEPLFPAADIPLVEMSLDRTLDAEGHMKTGGLLAPLRDEGVLIVASGNIIHNLALWRQSAGTLPPWAVDFRMRTNAAILSGDHRVLTDLSEDDRSAQLAVNSGEHYLPLLYTLGTRQEDDDIALFNDTLDGALSMTSVLVGDTAPLNSIA